MQQTFKYCAPVAGSLGFTCEDTAEAIGLMANAGIKSTQSGTALRTIMTALAGEVKFCGKQIGTVEIVTTNADGSISWMYLSASSRETGIRYGTASRVFL